MINLGSMPGIRTSEESRFGVWQVPLLVFAASLGLYLTNLGRPPHPDELYHVLAARGLLLTGEPRIAEGIYERVFLHTWLIAQHFRIFGESLEAARLPSALAMAGVVMVVFVWLRQTAGMTAAAIGAGLFAASPFAVDIAQFARFYGLQTITFVVGCLAVYNVVEGDHNRRWAYLAIAVPCLALAVYFQQTSLIGIAGLALWLVVRLIGPWFVAPDVPATRKAAALVALAFLALVGLVAVSASGILAALWETYRSVPLFNQSRANEFWFYHAWYNLLYPSLWPAVVLVGLAALAYQPRPVFFAATIFVVSFLLNSFAAPKGLRYFIYAQPFGFMVFGIGLAYVLKSLAPWLWQLRDQLVTVLPMRMRHARRTASGLIVFALLVLLVGNPATIRTVTLLANITVPPEREPIVWNAAREELESIFAEVDVVVTMAELEMLYFFDRYDILLSASRLSEIPEGVEFDRDFRTGRPVIGSLDSVTRVLTCYSSGVIVTNTRRWRDPDLIAVEIADFIALNTEAYELPGKSNVARIRMAR